MKRSFATLLGLCLASTPFFAHAEMQVQVGGAVNRPGVLALKDGARVSDAALAADVQPQAYLLGAAWLRPSLMIAQERLKAGILFDLDQLHLRAVQRSDTALSDTVSQLRNIISTLPVTGRAPALLAPRAVEANTTANLPLLSGDRLFYPLRPDTIRVVGTVQSPCSLPLQPLQDPPGYLAQCPSARGADHDWVYVIQPDGHVFRRGVALWNRSNPLSLAPGALIYVPLSARIAGSVDDTLNSDMADFLATQLLPGPGAAP